MPNPDIQESRNDLQWLEGSLLAAMRTWVLGCKRGVPSDQAVRLLFANLQTVDAATHLDALMSALNRGCTRMIEVSCTCEPALSTDESRLLDMFALLQDGRHEAATDVLRSFADLDAAYRASGHALAIVQVLQQAGHRLVRRPAALRRIGRSGRDAGECPLLLPGSGVVLH